MTRHIANAQPATATAGGADPYETTTGYDLAALPASWDATDHAIFDAKVRRRLPWRQVGEVVGMDFSWARRRFYSRMAKVTPAEVEAYRAEESAKLDEQEALTLGTYAAARQAGEFSAAVSALRELTNIGRARRQLLGLDTPVVQRFEVTDRSGEQSLDDYLAAYLAGASDAAPAPGDAAA